MNNAKLLNRTIKFRAWDEENDKMIPWNARFFDDTSPVTNWSGSFEFIEMPLMQFTGLVDREGVEVYEGDKVQLLYKTGFIRYNEKQAAYNIYFEEEKGLSEMNINKNNIKNALVVGTLYEKENDKNGI